MYIMKYKSGKYEYVRLMESYRDANGKPRQRLIENFGRYDKLIEQNPNAYEELCAKYQQQGQEKKQAVADSRYALIEQLLAGCEIDSDQPFPVLHYGHYVLKQLWQESLVSGRKELTHFGRFS